MRGVVVAGGRVFPAAASVEAVEGVALVGALDGEATLPEGDLAAPFLLGYLGLQGDDGVAGLPQLPFEVQLDGAGALQSYLRWLLHIPNGITCSNFDATDASPAPRYARPMTPRMVSAADAPAPVRRVASRAPLQRRPQSGDLPAAVSRLMSASTGTTPIVAAFQSSV